MPLGCRSQSKISLAVSARWKTSSYFHDAYCRGLIGHTLIFDRALSPDEIARMAR
jgi:hypothetical protein